MKPHEFEHYFLRAWSELRTLPRGHTETRIAIKHLMMFCADHLDAYLKETLKCNRPTKALRTLVDIATRAGIDSSDPELCKASNIVKIVLFQHSTQNKRLGHNFGNESAMYSVELNQL